MHSRKWLPVDEGHLDIGGIVRTYIYDSRDGTDEDDEPEWAVMAILSSGHEIIVSVHESELEADVAYTELRLAIDSLED